MMSQPHRRSFYIVSQTLSKEKKNESTVKERKRVEKCGFLGKKGHPGILGLHQPRKLPMELMVPASLPLSQVFLLRASSGLGAETTRVLALRGVHVIMADKDIAGGTEVRTRILEEIPYSKIDFVEMDLSSMASVRKFASDYKSSNRSLNLLINNAGVFCSPFTLSQDNIELQFATNYLGHFLLTHLLLDTMKTTVQESGKEGRIVNVSSVGHRLTSLDEIHFEELSYPSRYSSFFAYCQSKLAISLHTNELARHLKDDGVKITANSVHPGIIYTKIFRNSSLFDGVFRMLSKFVLKDIPQGAATICYVALHPEVEGISGEYFSDCNLTKPSKQAQDVTLGQRLWDFSMDLIK